MSSRQPLGSGPNANNHQNNTHQGLTFANYGSSAKTRTELLENRKKQYAEEALKGQPTSPKYQMNHQRRSVFTTGETIRNIVPPTQDKLFENAFVPFTHLREGTTMPKTSVLPQSHNDEPKSPKRLLDRSPIVVTREKKKHVTENINRANVNGVDKGGNACSFGHVPLSDVKYWYYLFNERSALDDPSIPLYSSFNKDNKFNPLKEKIFQKSSGHARQSSSPEKKGFNASDYFTNPHHARRTTFPSTLMVNGDTKDLFSQRHNYGSSRPQTPQTTSQPNSRPSSASITLRKKPNSVTLPERPMSARVPKPSIVAAKEEPVEYPVHQVNQARSHSPEELDSPSVSRIEELSDVATKPSGTFSNFFSPALPSKTQRPSATSYGVRKEAPNNTFFSTYSSETSSRLSSRNSYQGKPIDSPPSTVERKRPQSSYSPKKPAFSLSKRPSSAVLS
ncbi:hypothetical protein C9374_000067 [Naegleria lovaniensis]|uniref:Uncharacterized protein n=1 Tax=Naegleria lovaniensis TaxID=51637 RepID=A0AA88KNM6_NAELO|nr:uncharacterized protein C9374_000067 [Naegleria lovaniensis]KAG2388628.1 hypothetical protein C9374_000067 [Naegleria lovaniensis]